MAWFCHADPYRAKVFCSLVPVSWNSKRASFRSLFHLSTIDEIAAHMAQQQRED